MAGYTLHRRILVTITRMAGNALRISVFVAESKAGLAVIKPGVQPGHAAMTGGAIRAQLPLMGFILLVAGHAA